MEKKFILKYSHYNNLGSEIFEVIVPAVDEKNFNNISRDPSLFGKYNPMHIEIFHSPEVEEVFSYLRSNWYFRGRNDLKDLRKDNIYKLVYEGEIIEATSGYNCSVIGFKDGKLISFENVSDTFKLGDFLQELKSDWEKLKEKEIADLKSENIRLKQNISGLETKQRELLVGQEDRGRMINDLQTRLADSQNTTATRETQIEDLKRSKEALENDLRDTRNVITGSGEQIEGLEINLRNSRNEITTQKEEINALERIVINWTNIFQEENAIQVKEHITNLTQNLAEARREIDAKEEQITSLIINIEEWTATLPNQTTENIQGEITSLSNELKTEKKAKKNLRVELEQLIEKVIKSKYGRLEKLVDFLEINWEKIGELQSSYEKLVRIEKGLEENYLMSDCKNHIQSIKEKIKENANERQNGNLLQEINELCKEIAELRLQEEQLLQQQLQARIESPINDHNV